MVMKVMMILLMLILKGGRQVFDQTSKCKGKMNKSHY